MNDKDKWCDLSCLTPAIGVYSQLMEFDRHTGPSPSAEEMSALSPHLWSLLSLSWRLLPPQVSSSATCGSTPKFMSIKVNQLSLKSFVLKDVSLFLLQVEEGYRKRRCYRRLNYYRSHWNRALLLLNYVQNRTDCCNFPNITVNWRKLSYLCGQHKHWFSCFSSFL